MAGCAHGRQGAVHPVAGPVVRDGVGEDQCDVVVAELNEVQGKPMDIGGYYFPNDELASEAMRPSATLNGIIG